jgi:CelD/BcsL family acetyltransferase involved in cellulose biosynthesis
MLLDTMSAAIRIIPAGALTPAELAEWVAIQDANPLLASPFLRPEFTTAVSSVRDDVRVAVIEHSGVPVGFFSYQRDWMGIGRPVGGPLSDCQGIITKSDLVWDATRLIRDCGLREWKFDHLLAAQEPFRSFHRVVTQSPVIDLSKGYDAYVKDRRCAGSEQVTKTLQKRRKMEREIGALRFELHSTDPAMLNTLMRWKSRQYQGSGLVDPFSFSWVVKIVEKINSMQGESFAGMLSVLYAADKPIAAHMGMRSKTVWHYWFAAYDPAFARYSPGMILLLDMVKRASRLGIGTIDMGKGAERYKQSLMNGAIPIAEGVVAVSPLLSAARSLSCAVRAWLRLGPLDGLAKETGRIPGRLKTRLRFR